VTGVAQFVNPLLPDTGAFVLGRIAPVLLPVVCAIHLRYG
jgi:hypothetical protein